MTKRRLWILLGVAVISLAVCFSIPALALLLWRAGTLWPIGGPDPAAVVARDYATEKEGWPESDYTVENTHRWDNEGNLIVNVIHNDDLKSPMAGGGKSVELHIDMGKRRVATVLHFQ